jgi:Putative zinc dependent peptidase (DUF5700)
MRTAVAVLSLAALAAAAAPCRGQGRFGDRLRIRLDASEAEAVLAILAKRQAGQPVDSADWARLFATEPYRRLQARDSALHAGFTDADFERFVLSDSLAARADALRRTLADWRRTDLEAAAARAFAYLPADARIHATVYPVIKPRSNSFVFEPTTDPAIFLHLDPTESAAVFENTVAHELHHIGYASVAARFDSAIAALPPGPHAAAEWMSAFGEGYAMLAAAGGPDVDAHAESPPAVRARWDRDLAHFEGNFHAVERFLLAVADGRLKTPAAQDSVGYSFFGVQGPWYTVGWKMSVTIEKRFGRARLITCMFDPRRLLVAYDSAADLQNRSGGPHLPLWSPSLLQALGVRPPS